jgi:uncharacterized protein (DUF608 family)
MTAPRTPGRLFPPHLLHASWQQFEAAGYSQPVTGVIYRGEPRPTAGMPLGGLDTGCVDIEPNGLLGYSTLFNHLISPRLLLNRPFLGLHSGGQTYVLATDTRGKQDTPRPAMHPLTFPHTDYTPVYEDIGLRGVRLADSIDYWGHYPILDLAYATAAPVSVSLRAWAPFVPGDVVASMLPGAVFDLYLHNPGAARETGTLAFSWPGFETAPGAAPLVERRPVTGELNGLSVHSGRHGDAWEMAYTLAAVGPTPVRVGGPLNVDGEAWNAIAAGLPEAGAGETGASLAVDFDLAPGAEQHIRLVLTWHAPHWRAGGAPAHTHTHQYTHMYAKHYPSAASTALRLAREADAQLRRVIAWQEAIYQDPQVPGWLADSLINILHLIPEDSIWGQAGGALGDWCRPSDGLYAMNECPRGCPQFECIPCSFYGNIPIVYFFPEAALSTLRGYKAYQFPDGSPPWIFGGMTAREAEHQAPYDLGTPDKGYQTVLNAACYVDMADRYFRVTGDAAMLAEFWDSLKRANDFAMNLRPAYGDSQVIAMPTPGTDNGFLGDTEWFEAPEPGWKGYVTHAGGVRLAQVAIMRRLAEAMHDAGYMAQCDVWLRAGAEALEAQLWNGTYYLNFNEPETGTKSELVFGYQLDGQWMAHFHGVPGVFPAERVATTLQTLRDINCRLSQSGALNYANADGTAAKVGGYGTYGVFQPELFMLASTYMYEGHREFGLALLKKCLTNLVKWGYVWDAPNLTRGDMDTGQRAFGADYYQNMMLWALPAALHGQDIAGPAQAGGLVARVRAAGQAA